MNNQNDLSHDVLFFFEQRRRFSLATGGLLVSCQCCALFASLDLEHSKTEVLVCLVLIAKLAVSTLPLAALQWVLWAILVFIDCIHGCINHDLSHEAQETMLLQVSMQGNNCICGDNKSLVFAEEGQRCIDINS